MKGFSIISALITKLLQKKMKCEWDEKCQGGFKKLKEFVSSAPVLTQPVSGEEFVVYSDVFLSVLGCVLM